MDYPTGLSENATEDTSLLVTPRPFVKLAGDDCDIVTSSSDRRDLNASYSSMQSVTSDVDPEMPSEVTNLITWGKQRTVWNCCFWHILVLLALIFSGGLGGSIALQFVSQPMQTSLNNTIIANDYVLLLSNIDHLWSGTAINKLIYDPGEATLESHAVAKLFKLPYTQLKQYLLPKSLNTTLSDRIYFSNCSDYLGKCILEENLYFLNTDSATAVYTFILSSYKGDVVAVAFSNRTSYENYLNGNDYNDNYIKKITIQEEDLVFTLTSKDIEHPSYINVVIEAVDSKTLWFKYIRSGLQTFYDLEQLSSFCNITTNNTECMTDIGGGDDCILTQVEGSDKLMNIQSETSFVKSVLWYISICSIPIFGFALLVLLVIIIVAAYRCIRRKISHRTCCTC